MDRPELREYIRANVLNATDTSMTIDEATDQILALIRDIEKQVYDEALVIGLEKGKFEERERIIGEIEAMDKRHTVSFVLQALKHGTQDELSKDNKKLDKEFPPTSGRIRGFTLRI